VLRLTLLIVTVSSFVLNYPICEFFYPGNDYVSIRVWNYINVASLHTMYFLALLNIKLLSKNMGEVYKFILSVGIGFTVADIIDRWCFHITTFVVNDFFIIAIILIIEYNKYIKIKLKKYL